MLYIVMLPVKSDNKRNVVVISAPNYEVVRKVLGLPNGWDRYVQVTDLELEAIKQNTVNYAKLFLCTERY